MKTHELIKLKRQELGLSLADVADALGVNKTTVLRYESKAIEKMPVDIIPKLASILKLQPTTLMGWEETTYLKNTTVVADDFFPLPYRSNLSAGDFLEILEDNETDAIVYVPIKFQRLKKDLIAFKVNGDSMNKVIQHEDIVVVHHNPKAKINNGDIVVVHYQGECTLKRYMKNNNYVMLMPDSHNSEFEPILITGDEPLYLVGKVIWHCNNDNINKSY